MQVAYTIDRRAENIVCEIFRATCMTCLIWYGLASEYLERMGLVSKVVREYSSLVVHMFHGLSWSTALRWSLPKVRSKCWRGDLELALGLPPVHNGWR